MLEIGKRAWVCAGALLLAWACRGEAVRDDDQGTSSTSGTGGVAGAPPTASRPPDPPANGVPGDGPGYTFAVRQVFIGDTDWNGNPSALGWREFGYDIDQQVSTATSTDVCKPVAGAQPSIHDDGTSGIDNAFGKQIVPIFMGLLPTLSADFNDRFSLGELTYLFDIAELGSGPSYIDLVTRYYVGTNLGSPPQGDGSDSWPVAPELLADPNDISSSKIVFSTSYVTEHVWVSSPQQGVLPLPVVFGEMPLNLLVHDAVITMRLSPDRSVADHGIISGVLHPDELIQELQNKAGLFSFQWCDGTTFDQVATVLRQAADIMIDGSQDPTQTCNGISIGLGFTAVRAQVGSVAPPTAPAPDPCTG